MLTAELRTVLPLEEQMLSAKLRGREVRSFPRSDRLLWEHTCTSPPEDGSGTQRVRVMSAQLLRQTVSTYSMSPPWTLRMVPPPPAPRTIRVMRERERGMEGFHSTAAGPGWMSTQERNQFLPCLSNCSLKGLCFNNKHLTIVVLEINILFNYSVWG